MLLTGGIMTGKSQIFLSGPWHEITTTTSETTATNATNHGDSSSGVNNFIPKRPATPIRDQQQRQCIAECQQMWSANPATPTTPQQQQLPRNAEHKYRSNNSSISIMNNSSFQHVLFTPIPTAGNNTDTSNDGIHSNSNNSGINHHRRHLGTRSANIPCELS